jgi:hypothetical protein
MTNIVLEKERLDGERTRAVPGFEKSTFVSWTLECPIIDPTGRGVLLPSNLANPKKESALKTDTPSTRDVIFIPEFGEDKNTSIVVMETDSNAWMERYPSSS